MNFRNLIFMGILPCAAFAALGVQFFDPTGAPPARLSLTGIYADIGAKTPDTAMKYFEVNAALWSDGAAKKRWVILPPGKKIPYVDSTDYFDYPNQTIFVKNFYLDTVLNDSTTRRYWETRLLINKEDEQGKDFWYGFSYKWRKDASDADYVGVSGLDTTFNYYPKGTNQNLSYKKWTFPNPSACNTCHKVGTADDGTGLKTARGVLGFFPAQLKRPSSIVAGTHQIDALFGAGVFSGTIPGDSAKKARWKSLSETLPPTSQAEFRFQVLDTIARSYIGANCSGCHSSRNISVAGGPSADFDYDFYRLRPVKEFGALTTTAFGLDFVNNDTISLQDGRRKFILSVQRAGVNMTPGTPWDMSLPSGIATPTLITAGFPALSPLLYRQFALRRPPWRDSIWMRENLADYDQYNRKAWIFVNPWGSQAWRNDLSTHGLTLDDVITPGTDGYMMPLLATHLPDTAAMRILGEWAQTYRTLVPIEGQPIVTYINGKQTLTAPEGARIQNRQLIVPGSWTGKAQMFGVSGRAYSLASVGRGRYAIPHSAPSGVYFFKVGNRSFRKFISGN